MKPNFFKNHTAPTPAPTFLAAYPEFSKELKKFKKTLKEREKKLLTDLDNLSSEYPEINEKFKPPKVWIPLDRAQRILNCLNQIDIRIQNNNEDNLCTDDLDHLRSIIFYSTRCLPDNIHTVYTNKPMLSTEHLMDFKNSIEALNKTSLPSQKLAGHVLQLIGITMFVTVLLLSVCLSAGGALPILIATGSLGLVAAGSYLARNTPHRELQNDLNCTSKTQACNEQATEEPFEETSLKETFHNEFLKLAGI